MPLSDNKKWVETKKILSGSASNKKNVLNLPQIVTDWRKNKRKIHMKTENTAVEDLRSQKSTNLLIGYVLALATIFAAFEYTQREVKVVETDKIYEFNTEEDMIPITQQQEMVAPPPAAAPKTPEIINEVEDDTELPEEEIETTEEVNQAITSVVGTGAPSAVVASGPIGPVVEKDDDDRIWDIVEENAQFPGGDEACFKWLSEHIKYPSICQEQGVQGRVMVSFVVNKDGSIVDVTTLRSPDANLTKEAERVVKMMPKWKPARQGNKTVRSRFNLPVLFRLN